MVLFHRDISLTVYLVHCILIFLRYVLIYIIIYCCNEGGRLYTSMGRVSTLKFERNTVMHNRTVNRICDALLLLPCLVYFQNT